MSYTRFRQPLRHLCYALLLAASSACATGVTQEFVDDESSPSTGKNTGGSLGTIPNETGGSGNAQAGTSSGSGGTGVNPFGGSATDGGKSGGGSAGSESEGGSGDELGGSSSGGGGGGAGTAGTGGGSAGSGSGSCGCATTKAWVDNTNISFATNDCFTVGTATYQYVGTKAQTYANSQCNPSKQETWCTDSGNDYKFMLCP